MSLESWIEEFYPIEPLYIESDDDIVLLQHALKKWEGALPENCEKHDVEYFDHEIVDHNALDIDEYAEDTLMFGTTTCSLCQQYPFRKSAQGECTSLSIVDSTNKQCPIVRFLGRPCDRTENLYNIYSESRHDPKPMIKLLKDTVQFVEKENSTLETI